MPPQLPDFVKYSGPVGITAIVLVSLFIWILLKILNKVDKATDRHIKSLETILAKSNDIMSGVIESLRSMSESLKERPCMAYLTVEQLKDLIAIHDAKERERKILGQGIT
jgi:hypothetical protein